MQCGVGPPYNAALPLHRTALPNRNAGQILRTPVPVAPLVRTHHHRVREVVVRRALRPVGTAGETETHRGERHRHRVEMRHIAALGGLRVETDGGLPGRHHLVNRARVEPHRAVVNHGDHHHGVHFIGQSTQRADQQTVRDGHPAHRDRRGHALREHQIVGVERGLDHPAGNAYVRVADNVAGEERTPAPTVLTHAHQHLLGHNLADHVREGKFGTVHHLRLGARIEHFSFVRRDDLLAIHNFEN